MIELKVENFKPEFAGKMQFYLAVVDDLLRDDADGPSIGLIICKDRNRVVAEYSLRDTSKPIGVAEYVATTELPGSLDRDLPSAERISEQLSAMSE